MPRRSPFGGRHELGQNFLIHRPTIARIAGIVSETEGPILEIGPGDGSLTAALAPLGRDVTAIELDDTRIAALRRRFPAVTVEHADALRHPLDAAVIVGNIPFHLTTPILRRLLSRDTWSHAVLLTQWEVARKRAGVGGRTMLTAQAAPWFDFTLHGRVPAHHFRPRPSVDGGILAMARRARPLVPPSERRRYEAFVRAVFTGSGGSLDGILRRVLGCSGGRSRRVLSAAAVDHRMLPRDLDADDWARLWALLSE